MGKALHALGCKMLIHLPNWLEVCQKKVSLSLLESMIAMWAQRDRLCCSSEWQLGSATTSQVKGNLCPPQKSLLFQQSLVKVSATPALHGLPVGLGLAAAALPCLGNV